MHNVNCHRCDGRGFLVQGIMTSNQVGGIVSVCPVCKNYQAFNAEIKRRYIDPSIPAFQAGMVGFSSPPSLPDNVIPFRRRKC